MERSLRRTVAAGALAGLAAGLVVALWYLALDLTAGQPLETPARLAAVILERPFVGVQAGPVLAYTALHLAVFVSVGAAAGGLLAFTGLNAGLIVGSVLGLGVMSSLYYSALAMSGAPDLELLPGHHVLGANLTAGLVWAGIVGWSERGERSFGFEILGSPFLVRSVATGLVGAAAVAVWFLVVDVLRGQPLLTPAALGSALLGHTGGAGTVAVTPGVVAFYTVVHLGLFTVAGFAFEVAADRLERAPSLWYLAVMAFIVLDAVFLPAAALLGMWILGTLSIWAVAVANLLAVIGMTWWTLRRRPELGQALSRQISEERGQARSRRAG